MPTSTKFTLQLGGTNTLPGGTTLTIFAADQSSAVQAGVRHALDAFDDGQFPVTNDGSAAAYVSVDSTTCGVTWTCSSPPVAGAFAATWDGDTNVVECIPSANIVQNSGNSCNLVLDIDYNTASGDGSPLVVESASAFTVSCNTTAGGGVPLNATGNSVEAFFIDVCQVSFDKQISCDDGNTFTDVGALGSTQGCVSNGGQIQAKWIATNTGSVDATCTIEDDLITVPAGGVDFPLSSTPVEIESVLADCSNETSGVNTGTLSCACASNGTTITLDPIEDQARHDCCSVELTKEVSCGPDDAGQTTFGDGCTGWNDPAEPVTGRFTPENTGTVGVICTPSEAFPGDGITDNATFLLGGAEDVGTLDPGETGTAVEDTAACDPDGRHDDTGTLNCVCLNATGGATELRVSATDPSWFFCQTPGLSLTKTCDQQAEEENPFLITVENTGTADLINCTITDNYFADVAECANLTEGDTPTAATTNPASIDILQAGSDAVDVTGSIAGLAAQACNTVSVTCEIVGAFDEAGLPKTITAEAQDECEVGRDDCITRTPGFWGTHPHITSQFLPLESCGVNITHTNDGLQSGNGSATEDMCSVGTDPKTKGVLNQQVQLERQCMAANLNVAASTELGLSCEAALPGTDDMLAECCNAVDSACRSSLDVSGETADERTLTGCIDALDAFNNDESAEPAETLAPFISPGPANPSECQDSKNNGFLNDRPRFNVPVKPCKGKKCP